MKFESFIAILTFSVGVAFTLIDTGFDMKLASEYWNGSYCIFGCESTWDDCYQNCNQTDGDSDCFRNCTEFKYNCHHKCSGQSDSSNPIFAMFTTSWIVLGGLAQSFLVARLLFRGDARLIWLPKPIQILLLICAPILMAPVIVNVYGVIFVTRHADEDGIQDDVLRFEIV